MWERARELVKPYPCPKCYGKEVAEMEELTLIHSNNGLMNAVCDTQQFLLTREVNAQRQIHRFDPHCAGITYFGVDAIQIDDGIDTIQWSDLPRFDFVNDGVSHRRNQGR